MHDEGRIIELLDSYRVSETRLKVELNERRTYYGWIDHVGKDHFVLALEQLTVGLGIDGVNAAVKVDRIFGVSVAEEPKVAMKRPAVPLFGHHEELGFLLEEICSRCIGVTISCTYPHMYNARITRVASDYVELAALYPPYGGCTVIPCSAICAVADLPGPGD